MSLIFEALKKGHAPSSEPLAASTARQPAVAAAVAASAPAAPLSGLFLAVLAGMLLAGGGAWLYWAGKASNVSNPNSPPPVALAPSAATPTVASTAVLPSAPVAAPAPAAAPVAVVPPAPVVAPTPAAAKPVVAPATIVAAAQAPIAAPVLAPPVRAPKVVASAPVPAAASPTVAAPAIAAAAAPASKAVAVAPPEPKPVPRAPINTHVQVNIEPNPFDVREVFQQFVQLLQAGQMPEAQVAADRISSAMGRGHVMSLRAQGYLALKKGDLGLARGQYFLLHQLLPEDREAGLNLALIEWRQGDRDSASKRVAVLLERFPNDQEIQALYLNVRTP